MPDREKIIEALEYIDDNYAKPAFFRRLAELGIIPENEKEAEVLIKLGEEAGELLRRLSNAEMEKFAADSSAYNDPKLIEAVCTLFGRD